VTSLNAATAPKTPCAVHDGERYCSGVQRAFLTPPVPPECMIERGWGNRNCRHTDGPPAGQPTFSTAKRKTKNPERAQRAEGFPHPAARGKGRGRGTRAARRRAREHSDRGRLPPLVESRVGEGRNGPPRHNAEGTPAPCGHYPSSHLKKWVARCWGGKGGSRARQTRTAERGAAEPDGGGTLILPPNGDLLRAK
jgi:hypothetical protein